MPSITRASYYRRAWSSRRPSCVPGAGVAPLVLHRAHADVAFNAGETRTRATSSLFPIDADALPTGFSASVPGHDPAVPDDARTKTRLSSGQAATPRRSKRSPCRTPRRCRRGPCGGGRVFTTFDEVAVLVSPVVDAHAQRCHSRPEDVHASGRPGRS
jgi:hypothetical protein